MTVEHPFVDLRVLRHRSVWAGSLLSVVVGMGLYGALFAVPIFAQERVLVSKLVDVDINVTERVHAFTAGFLARGYDMVTARTAGLTALDGMVNAQSAVMSFADRFWLTSMLFFISLPLIFLLGKPQAGATIDSGH